MRIEFATDKHAEVVRPHGLLVGSDAQDMESQLQSHLEAGGPLVIDMSGLVFADSRGLEALVHLAEYQIRNGRTLKLAGAKPVLQEVLELTELEDLFESYPDVAAALESCP